MPRVYVPSAQRGGKNLGTPPNTLPQVYRSQLLWALVPCFKTAIKRLLDFLGAPNHVGERSYLDVFHLNTIERGWVLPCPIVPQLFFPQVFLGRFSKHESPQPGPSPPHGSHAVPGLALRYLSPPLLRVAETALSSHKLSLIFFPSRSAQALPLAV